VSDVALAKTCRKLAIPLPGRGYWARLRAGQKLKRTPLPSSPAGVPQTLTVHRAPPPPKEREASAETAARVEKESTEEAAIVVADTLERPASSGERREQYFRSRNRPLVSHLDISVARDSLDRALRIMDALIKALVARDLTVEVTEMRIHNDGYYRHADRSPDSNATRVRVEGSGSSLGWKRGTRCSSPSRQSRPNI